MSDSLYILAVVAATSGAAYAAGRRLGMRAGLVPAALRRAIRLVGACLLFWGGNIAVGAGVALLVRGLGLGFLWLYVNTDVSVLVLSAVQALVFESWRTQHQHEQERAQRALERAQQSQERGPRADDSTGCPAAPGLAHEPLHGARE
ncbi:hypothetical protein [Sorangium sp. So ce1182]|uniref:hypothetical protein n=1 Tax=Sorangium sp. So ce1182 TaxID=3133334 RepID=UPI003F643CB7